MNLRAVKIIRRGYTMTFDDIAYSDDQMDRAVLVFTRAIDRPRLLRFRRVRDKTAARLAAKPRCWCGKVAICALGMGWTSFAGLDHTCRPCKALYDCRLTIARGLG